MANRIRTIEQHIGAPLVRPGKGRQASMPRTMSRPAPRAASFSASFDDGGPIAIFYDGVDAARATSFGSGASDRWRWVGVRSERGYAEPLEEYDAPDPAVSDGREAEPSVYTSDDPLTEAEPPPTLEASYHDGEEDEEDGKAFSAEIAKLLSQVKGGGPAAPAPAAVDERRAARGALPDSHPHAVFDRMDMSFANSFDGGVVDLDAVERAATPRPRASAARSLARRALDEVDVIEDLAFIRSGAEAAAPAKQYDLASDAVLTPEIEARLAPIAELYQKETGRRVFVTSGRRTPEAQARAMFKKLEGGDDLSIYKNKDAIADIKRAYETAKNAGKTADEIVAAMSAVIEAQVAGGIYISRHLFAGAVDVRSRDMSEEEKAAFRKAVGTQKDVTVLLESTPPHFHLEFK